MDEGEHTRSSCLFTYVERSVIPVLVAANGLRIRDNVRRSHHPTRCSAKTLIISYRRSKAGWCNVSPRVPSSLRYLILVPLVPYWVISPHTHLSSAVAYPQKDLDHYRCNNVYRPWVNKGGRRSNTLRNGMGTSTFLIHHRPPPYPLGQLGGTATALVPDPRVEPAPSTGRGAARRMSTSPALSSLCSQWICFQSLCQCNLWRKPTSTMDNGVRPRNVSSCARGGAVITC